MDLPDFIRAAGVTESAELFEVSERLAKAWLYRERSPKPKKALHIATVTRGHKLGRVTFAECYPQ